MSSETARDLLVAGAGPVGLVTAILGARAGLQVEVIDQEWRIAARSYACVLHPRSLELLHDFGLLTRALELGIKVETVGFYEGEERKAELHLSQLNASFPFALVLYQDDLEGMLEDHLRDRHGCRVNWGRRLEAVEWEPDAMLAVVERLQHAPTGDQNRRWEEVVDRRSLVRARYLVGADGTRSRVAHLLGTSTDSVGDPRTYAIYEFEPQSDAGPEVRIALHAGTTNVLWPLPGGTCRWNMEAAEPGSEGNPDEAHETITPLEAPVGGGGRQRLVRRIQQVAPWFTAGVHHLDWAMRLEFPERIIHQFGRGNCWLLGDSAHQAAPGGAHSLNLGLAESVEWVDTVRRILREGEPTRLLSEWNHRWREHWRQLLRATQHLTVSPTATPWVAANADRLIQCLPASGAHLEGLMGQLGVSWK